jgi:hypothetical protein
MILAPLSLAFILLATRLLFPAASDAEVLLRCRGVMAVTGGLQVVAIWLLALSRRRGRG